VEAPFREPTLLDRVIATSVQGDDEGDVGAGGCCGVELPQAVETVALQSDEAHLAHVGTGLLVYEWSCSFSWTPGGW
jgi:hypothetical protein